MNSDAISSTCDLCDEHKSDSSGALRVLPPVFHSYGGRARMAGLVSTVQCLDDNSRVKEAVNTPGNGRVLLVDAGGTVRRSMVGGLLAEAAARNGWAGVVVWGAVRDKAELAAAELGVFALALTPMPTDRKDQGLRDVPVQIDGLLIRPGEYLVADEDGIVVLPTRL